MNLSKAIISSLYLQLFVGWLMFYLRYLCVLSTQWCPTHNVLCFCFVCLRLVYPILSVSQDCPFLTALWYSLTFIVYTMLPVSLDCPFLIAPSIFSNVYCVHYVASFYGLSFFDCPFRYSLTFIYLVYPMLPVSLDCPFLIALSVFSNIYLVKVTYA